MNKRDLQTGKVGYVTDGAEIPQNAVMLSSEQILSLQMKVMKNWEPSKEMFAMKYGSFVLGGCAALSGFVFCLGLRNIMLLRRLPKSLMFIPSTGIPFLTTALGQDNLVAQDIALGTTGCTYCLRVRTCLIQVTAGLIQPLGLALCSASVMAKYYATYPLPNLKDYGTLFNVYRKMLKPMKGVIMTLALANVLIASGIQNKQSESIDKVNRKILESASSTTT